MLALTGRQTIWLCTQVTDMRRSFDGLSAQVKQQLNDNPQNGALFVFINRRRTQMKCLYYEAGGYCLWSKRLEQGQYALPKHDGTHNALKQSLHQTELLSLIEGLDLIVTKQRKRYK